MALDYHLDREVRFLEDAKHSSRIEFFQDKQKGPDYSFFLDAQSSTDRIVDCRTNGRFESDAKHT